MTRNWPQIGRLVLASLIVSMVVLGLNSCRRDQSSTVERALPTISTSPSKLSTCVPVAQPDPNISLTLVEIRNESERTAIKIVAQAVQGPADFYVPQYLMSRGRWLINEQGRAYLRDEQCREYKLKDRTPAVGKIPDSGRVELKPSQAYELTLSFPRLLEEVKTGVLVYGNWVLPFTLS